MERLLPAPRVEALDEVYADLVLPSGDRRPHLYLGMVSSVDGAAVVDGRTRDLGGEGDRAAFRRLRETCDVILVGAGTARREDYGPPRAPADVVDRRAARGLAPRATIAVVTGSADLDPGARLFSDPSYRPVVLTSATAAADALAEVADVVRCDDGDGGVDLGVAVGALHARGARRVLCEGGPSLNAALLAAGLVDELFLTLAPTVVGASPLRIVEGHLSAPVDAELVELRHHRGELLLRYRLGGTAGAAGGHPDAPGGPR